MSTKPSSAVSANVEQMSDRVADKATQTVAATRQLANDALDKTQDGIDSLHERAPAALSRAAASVEDLTRRTVERARLASSQVRDQVNRAGDYTVGYIKDEPVKSVLIAAAAGAATAALVSWLASRRR